MADSEDVGVVGVRGLVCVVTGGANGIGAAIVQGLSDAGALVASLDISTPTDKRSGVLDVDCDVSDPRKVSEAVSVVEAALGVPSVVVNNAALLLVAGTEETSLEEWNRIIAVNLTGPFLLAKRCIPAMKRQGFGRLINIGSNSGKMGGVSGVPAYAASKAGLHNLSRAWATELGPFGITANTIAACMIDTDMARGANLEALIDRVPVRRMGRPEEVAWTVQFLADRRSGYVNGEVMDLNGGFYLD